MAEILDPRLTGAERRLAVEIELRIRARFDGSPRVEEKLLVGNGWTATSFSKDYAVAVAAWTLTTTELQIAEIRIAELETICDPAGMVQQIASQKEQIDGLLVQLAELRGETV